MAEVGQRSGRWDTTDARWRAWRGVLEVSSFVTRRVDEALRDEVGIDIQTYDALLHTREAGDAGVRMTDLADRVLLTKAGLTARVDRLEEQGWLARRADPDDRRVTRVVLTPAGWELFRRAARVHDVTVERWFGDLVEDGAARTMAETLARVRSQHRDP
jgi:DNA-binding MarR family transcriptional regulator